MSEVNARFTLPFQPRPLQLDAIRKLAGGDRSGWYADPGTGKTLMSTVVSLYQRTRTEGLATFVIMPYPILIPGWVRWLKSIEGIGKVVDYRGSPAQRKAMNIGDADYIVMTTNIFKLDWERLGAAFEGRPLLGIIDEAHCIKNVGSQTYRAVRDFFSESGLLLLTGTPLTTPGDAYAYVKTVSPPIYRSHGQFENIHVAERDFFGKVTKWSNLQLLQDNFMNNSVRLLKEEMLKDLKEPVYRVIDYDLAPAHMKLYNDLMSQQMLELEDGGKIDATTAQRLYHAAQQIIVNYDFFSGNEKNRSAALDVVDSVLDEIGISGGKGINLVGDQDRPKKLIIFGEYTRTNGKLHQYLQPYGAVACYGDISRAQQDKAVERFLTDPTCLIMVANTGSAGFGWNPQEVCSDVLFLEEPVIPSRFVQAVGRIYRDGQLNTPVVRIAIASGTIQNYLHRRLLEKDQLINKVQLAYKDLKDALHGQ